MLPFWITFYIIFYKLIYKYTYTCIFIFSLWSGDCSRALSFTRCPFELSRSSNGDCTFLGFYHNQSCALELWTENPTLPSPLPCPMACFVFCFCFVLRNVPSSAPRQLRGTECHATSRNPPHLRVEMAEWTGGFLLVCRTNPKKLFFCSTLGHHTLGRLLIPASLGLADAPCFPPSTPTMAPLRLPWCTSLTSTGR